MKKRTIKSRLGFTIVELVVVIAVIAALAAILIPTFVNVVNSANNSSDEQSVKNMNTALAADQVLNDKPLYLCGVWAVLEENGYSSEVSPNYSANTFYWYKSENRIVIVRDGQISFPAEYEGITVATAHTNGGGKITVAAKVTATSLTVESEVFLLNTDKDNVSAHQGPYSSYGDTCALCGRTLGTSESFTNVANTAVTTTLVSDVSYVCETEDKGIYSTEKAASINKTTGGTIDLAGYTISISSLSGKNGVNTGATTSTIQNGIITMNYSCNGSSYGVIRNNGGNLTLDNMTVELTGTGYCVNAGSNGTITIKDTTIISNSENETTTYSLYVGSSTTATISGNSKIVGITYLNNSATLNIEDGDFTESEIKIGNTTTINISGGKFDCSKFVTNNTYSSNIKINITGGTFIGNPSDNSLMTVAEGYSVVNNNDGTYTVKASA